jgi:hypothetical protein
MQKILMAYRSEIRDSKIKKLEDKVAAGKYGTYLRRITLKKVRSFEDRVVTFEFPVTAIVGPMAAENQQSLVPPD